MQNANGRRITTFYTTLVEVESNFVFNEVLANSTKPNLGSPLKSDKSLRQYSKKEHLAESQKRLSQKASSASMMEKIGKFIMKNLPTKIAIFYKKNKVNQKNQIHKFQ